MTKQKNISTGAETDYTYDNAGRMTNATLKDGEGTITDAIDYTYDIYGNLIGRTETPYTDGVAGAPATELFVYDPLNNTVVLQFDGSGNLTDRYLWNPDGTNQILADEKVTSLDTAGDVYWPLNDNLGSVVDVVATDGTLENHTAYSPFGAATPTVQAVDEIFGAYGEMTDPTLDDLFTPNRIGNTGLQRWNSTDPSGLGPDVNPYRDVGNDPVDFIDPTGLRRRSPVSCGCQNDHNTANNNQGSGTDSGGDSSTGILGLLSAGSNRLYDVLHNLRSRGHLGYSGPLDPNDPRIVMMQAQMMREADDQASQSPEFQRFSAMNPIVAAAMRAGEDYGVNTWERGGVVATNALASGSSANGAIGLSTAMAVADFTGVTNVSDAFSGTDAVYGNQLSTGQRWLRGIMGAAQLAMTGNGLADAFGGLLGDAEGAGAGGMPREPGVPTEPGVAAPDPQPTAAPDAVCQAGEQGGCFFVGTPVATKGDHKPVQSVRADDLVRAFNLKTGAWELCRVVETYETDYVGEKIRVRVAGEWIESTAHHPVWVSDGKNLDARPRPEHVRQAETAGATVVGRWVDAYDLQVGDVLLLKPDRRAAIEAIEVQQVAATVYNFQVEGLHNYAVGYVCLLVHNNAPCSKTLFEDGFDSGKLNEATEQEAGLQEIWHHSDPMFMGGDPSQPLTPMSNGTHIDLHNDLNSFLEGETDGLGNSMRPSATNSADRIQFNFSRDQLLDAMSRFYQAFYDTYPDAAVDFFSQHPDLW